MWLIKGGEESRGDLFGGGQIRSGHQFGKDDGKDTLPPQRCEALLQVKVLSKLRTPLILTPWQMTSLTEVQQLLGKP